MRTVLHLEMFINMVNGKLTHDGVQHNLSCVYDGRCDWVGLITIPRPKETASLEGPCEKKVSVSNIPARSEEEWMRRAAKRSYLLQQLRSDDRYESIPAPADIDPNDRQVAKRDFEARVAHLRNQLDFFGGVRAPLGTMEWDEEEPPQPHARRNE